MNLKSQKHKNNGNNRIIVGDLVVFIMDENINDNKMDYYLEQTGMDNVHYNGYNE